MRVRMTGGQLASSQARVSARKVVRSDMRFPPAAPGHSPPTTSTVKSLGFFPRMVSDSGKTRPYWEATMATPHYDWIAYHATTRGDHTAMVDLATGREFTYAQFHERVGRLASGLRSAYGVKHGDRVGVLAHNSSDVFEIQFACARLGAVFVPMNWLLTVPELTVIVGAC